MKTTILGGVLFLAPIAVLAILLGKIFELSLAVAKPIDAIIPLESFVGIATVNLLAVALIFLVCYLAGLLAEWAMARRSMQRIDGLFQDLIPPYAIFKAVISSATAKEDFESLMKPVLVRFDDYDQVAFELERSGHQSVLFLPGAPSAWSGAPLWSIRTAYNI